MESQLEVSERKMMRARSKRMTMTRIGPTLINSRPSERAPGSPRFRAWSQKIRLRRQLSQVVIKDLIMLRRPMGKSRTQLKLQVRRKVLAIQVKSRDHSVFGKTERLLAR